MEACNIVRMRVKPEYEAEFLALNDNPGGGIERGLWSSVLVRTGERSYCLVGHWDSMEALSEAQPALAAALDGVRHMLEDLGDGMGCADPMSGHVVARRRFPAAEGEVWSG